MHQNWLLPSPLWQMPRVMSRDTTCAWVSERVQPWTEAAPGDVTLVGVPFDHAVNFRPGTRFGPKAIREALGGQTLYITDRRGDASSLTLTDGGDVDLVHSLEESYRRIEEALAVCGGRELTVILGGDHSITRPSIRGTMRRLEARRLGLIVFDAHFDSRVPVPGKEHSGHWLRLIQEEMPDRIRGTNIALIGLSAGSYGPANQADADSRGILSFTVSEVRRQGIADVMERSLRHANEGTDGLYISVDIDAIHQAFAPGTSVPNPNGLSPEVILDGVFEAARAARVVALDITEVNPVVDNGGVTAGIAAQIVFHALAGVAARRALSVERHEP